MFLTKISKFIRFILITNSLALFAITKSNAITFNANPSFSDVGVYTSVISQNNDLADLYYPKFDSSNNNQSFPIALFLQGALVDKSFYSNYANLVAKYGFIVVVPNHFRSLNGFTGFFSETSQIDAVLRQLETENESPSSPISGIVDTEKLGLLGHSLGAAVGLSAIGNYCLTFYCEGTYRRPPQVLAGAFFGANLRDTITNQYLPIDNGNVPIALLQGSLDGRALPERAFITYENIKNPPKALITVLGANHFVGITNIDNPPGAIPDPISPTLDNITAVETVARWTGLFLQASLLNDRQAFDYIYKTGDDLDPNVTVIVSVPEPAFRLNLTIILAISFLILFRKKSH